MKKRKIVLIFSLLISICMLLAACVTDDDQSTDPIPQQNEASPEAETEETVDDSSDDIVRESTGPLGRFDPPIEMTTARSVNTELTMPADQDHANNVWYTAMYEELGINLTLLWTADGEQFATRMNLAMASGEMPDLAMVNKEQFNQLVITDSIADLTEVFEEFASEDTKRQMAVGDSIALRACTVDGRLRAMPNTASPIAGAFEPLLWLRTDWLDNLGLAEPETLDDMFNIMRAFAHDDPNGTGQDTVGFGFMGGHVATLPIFHAYHANPGAWIKNSNGEIVYGSVQPEMRNALEQLQALYLEGVIDPEFPVADWGLWVEMMVSGTNGFTAGPHWIGELLPDGKINDPNMEWKPFIVPTVDGRPSRITLRSPVLEYYVVREDFEHPEALIKMFNFWYDITVGENATEENFKKFFNDGTYFFSMFSPITTNDATDTPQRQLIEAVENDCDSGITSAWTQATFDRSRLAVAGEYQYFASTFYYPAWRLKFEIMDNGWFIMDEFFGPPSPTMSERWASIHSLEIETFTLIIMGQEPIESFDSFVEQWHSLGGEQITREVNEWYASVN